jgi:hypothetical protein
LQGAFEICAPANLGDQEVKKITEHLDLVDACVKGMLRRKRTPMHYGFCKTLRAIIADQVTLSQGELATVKKLLNAEFVHIDADTEGDQDAMNHIHNTGRPPGGTLRC